LLLPLPAELLLLPPFRSMLKSFNFLRVQN
jgi:hypothetical protein